MDVFVMRAAAEHLLSGNARGVFTPDMLDTYVVAHTARQGLYHLVNTRAPERTVCGRKLTTTTAVIVLAGAPVPITCTHCDKHTDLAPLRDVYRALTLTIARETLNGVLSGACNRPIIRDLVNIVDHLGEKDGDTLMQFLHLCSLPVPDPITAIAHRALASAISAHVAGHDDAARHAHALAAKNLSALREIATIPA